MPENARIQNCNERGACDGQSGCEPDKSFSFNPDAAKGSEYGSCQGWPITVKVGSRLKTVYKSMTSTSTEKFSLVYHLCKSIYDCLLVAISN